MSASQEWSEALKAGMGIEDDSSHLTGFHYDMQADFLPTSTQSPVRSPQPSPDSQQKDVSGGNSAQNQQHIHATGQLHQHNVGSVSQQEQHVSQSYIPPPSGAYGEHSGQMAPRQSLGNSNTSCQNTSNVNPGHPQGLAARPSNFTPRCQNAQMDQGHFAHPQNRMPRPTHPHDGHQIRPAVRHPHNIAQQRQVFSGNAGPRQNHQPRMSAPAQSPGSQNSGRQYQQQPLMNHGVRQQQPRHTVPSSSAGPVLSPNKCNTQNLRPQSGALSSAPGQMRHFSPGHPQSHPRSAGPPQGIRQPNPNYGNRFMPPRHPVSQGYVGHGMPPQKRPNGGPGAASGHLPGRPDYSEEMFEDDEDYDEDYDEDMEADEEEGMYRNNFHQNINFPYPESDSDDNISEEESALLEELTYCEDEQRYDEILMQLREKGVDSEELEEIIYNRPFQSEIYPGGPFDDDDDDEEEEDDDDENEENMEEEGLVSSSSQRNLGLQQNSLSSQLSQQRLPPPQTPVGNIQHGINQAPGGQKLVSKPPHSQNYQPASMVHPSGPGQAHALVRPPMKPGTNQLRIAQSNSGQCQQQNWQPMKFPAQGEMRLPNPKTIPLAPVSTPTQRPPLRLQQQTATAFQGDKACSVSNPTGVVKPVQNAPSPNNSNSQSFSPGQASQNKLNIQQGPPAQQPPSNPAAPPSQQGPSQPLSCPAQPPLVRGAAPKASAPAQTQLQPEASDAQQNLRLNSPHPFNKPHNTPQTGASFSKASLAKETNEATLARLEVQYMQQSLDEEIKAKKGGGPSQSRQHFINQNPAIRPPPQQQQQQPVYQPKHQLPPRQPIPAICDPNSSSLLTPGGRPICSVVPFTAAQSRLQVCAGSPHRNTVPVQQQPNTFVRPRNPGPLSVQTNTAPAASPIQTGCAQGQQNSMSQLAAPPLRGQMSPVQSSGQASPQDPYFEQSKLQDQSYQPSQQSQAYLSPQLPQAVQNSQPSPLPQTLQPSPLQHAQPTPSVAFNNCKSSDTFSLDSLSEDKCIVKAGKGHDRLTKGMVYQIRSPKDQSLVFAVWNGEKFEDLRDEDLKAIQSKNAAGGKQMAAQKQQVTDVGYSQKSTAGPINSSDKEKSKSSPSPVPAEKVNSKFQAEFLHSINQSTGDHRSEQETSSNQSTYVKPLTMIGQKKEDTDEEDDDTIFKKPFPEQEDYFRVCKHCGYTSKSFRRCDGCSRVFQGDIKVHTMKKNTNKSVTPTAQSAGSKTTCTVSLEDPFSSVMENVSFYGKDQSPSGRGRGKGRGARGASRARGGGMKGRSGARSSQEGSNSDSDDSGEGKRSSDGSGSSFDTPAKKRPPRQKSKNPAPRKRSKKQDEPPVTLTISSDEDEPSSTSNSLLNNAPSPAGADSPIFPSLPLEPINAFGRFRRVRMEDEDGISRLSKKMEMKSEVPMMDRREEEEEDDDEEDDEVPIYEIDIRSVRIGSMRTQPEGPLMINMRGICFKVRSERTDEAFECEILAQEVELVKYFSGQTQPVLFLLLTQECGEKLREICHMEPGDDEFFDPSSTDMKQKMVVIIIECFNYMPEAMLKETLSLWADMNQMDDEDFIEELTEEGANDLLIQSAPPVLTAGVDKNMIKFKKRYRTDCNEKMLARPPLSPSDSIDNEPDSTSSSPPEIRHVYGTNVRLLQYPPPPLRGIPITTEDLYCLIEGEFLNDVIIDFYLQYLYLEKLSPENRERTHIFSSFFYKRLTQRDRHVEKSEEDAKKSLPERRHARVKKWTKTVDLFSKDFIVVPINEHSHWYLAVICFPGLAAPEPVSYVPNKSHLGEEDSPESGVSKEGTEEETPVNNSQENRMRTILGKHVNPEETNESKCDGIRQPCILMFDSLAGPSRAPNVKMLREYLQCEWNAKKADSEPRNISKILRGSTPRVPQQSNYSDCGVYLLQYVESFFDDPIGDFQIPMKGLQSWFHEDLVINKRRNIHELIMSLHKRYQEERGDTRILDIKYDTTPREPPMRIQSRLEESVSTGNRDDESSNSSMSGDVNGDLSAALLPPPLDNFLLYTKDSCADGGSQLTSEQKPLQENLEVQRNFTEQMETTNSQQDFNNSSENH
ncbi:hypothetical protein Btru_016862 [Bulinus truncatus]|nr:hypothetical protein Btru_016862 [Bulinus truncatus]